MGEWAWTEVSHLLSSKGYAVTALTLPGQGPDDPNRALVTTQDQAEAILSALDEEASRRILVLHSGAALPGTVVLDQHPSLVDHAVWVDTAPVADGFAMDTDLPGETLLLESVWDQEFEGGSMRDLTEEQLATFKERAVPEPGLVVSQPVALSNEARHAVPSTVICTAFSSAEYRSYAEDGVPFLKALVDYTDVTFVDLPTGHWPMWSTPAELAEVIASVGQ